MNLIGVAYNQATIESQSICYFFATVKSCTRTSIFLWFQKEISDRRGKYLITFFLEKALQKISNFDLDNVRWNTNPKVTIVDTTSVNYGYTRRLFVALKRKRNNCVLAKNEKWAAHRADVLSFKWQ